jgi:hypothetical protein
LGTDTVPGPLVGAPLVTSRKVDDYDTRRTVYPSGITTGLNEVGRGVLGNLDKSAAGHDTPIKGHGQQANKHETHKSDAVDREDPTQGLGVHPEGVLGRE